MRALMDCDNFFVSCERVFNPSLNGMPVVVLSGNDGCVIARSNEAKKLGIPMGAPAFQYAEMFKSENVKCLSGNHVLYSDMSRRVMTLLTEEADNVEIYSVDEAFFDFSAQEKTDRLERLASKIFKGVGIPVSIGVSYSRTLAKVACRVVKKQDVRKFRSFILSSQAEIDRLLKTMPVGDVWGIGRKLRKRLEDLGVSSAFDFFELPQALVRDKFSIVAERTWLELHKVDCNLKMPEETQRQSIAFSRTFPKEIEEFEILTQVISSFSSECAKVLRSERLLAGNVTVYISGNRFSDVPMYANSIAEKFPMPTSSSIEIGKMAVGLLMTIYRKNYGYKRAGIVLGGLEPLMGHQMSLFDNIDEAKHLKLMETIDNINRLNKSNSVHLLSDGLDRTWRPNMAYKSRNFSTSFKDIIEINSR